MACKLLLSYFLLGSVANIYASFHIEMLQGHVQLSANPSVAQDCNLHLYATFIVCTACLHLDAKH